MLTIRMCQVRARKADGMAMAPRQTWLEPAAATAFTRMNGACGQRIAYNDVYRSTLAQILGIRNASKDRKRLYAPPTKSGHNFGFSLDLAIAKTLENFRKSGQPDLVVASRDRAALGRWMAGFGWTGIESENWHFNFLDGRQSAVKKIDEVYGQQLRLDNIDVQRALNRLLKLDKPLATDGQLGPLTREAAARAREQLGYDDEGEFDPWFRRLLAGATVTIEEVSLVE